MSIDLSPVGPPALPFRPPAPPFAHELSEPAEGDSIETNGDSVFFSFQYHMERLTIDKAQGTFLYESYDLSIQYQGSVEMFQQLQDHFSPENTADRIFSQVLKGFGRTSFGQTDTADSRQGFVDFILPHIRQGVDEALAMFQPFEDIVRAPAEDTFSRIEELLSQFAREDEEENDDADVS